MKKEGGVYDTFTYTFYEVKEFTTARNFNDRNILSRLRNSLVTALNEHKGLPKLIVFVIDDDIITSAPTNSEDSITQQYEYILNALFKLIERSIDCYKDVLPAKAKREHVPHILWMAPPTHKFFSESNNEKRCKFANALNNVVLLYTDVTMLRLVKSWNHEDSNLFLKEQYRYTSEGLRKY